MGDAKIQRAVEPQRERERESCVLEFFTDFLNTWDKIVSGILGFVIKRYGNFTWVGG
jgi:hypothetical protein